MAKHRDVEGGTPANTKRLCESCAYGQVLKSDNSHELVYCHASGWQVTPIHIRVVECSKYISQTEQSLRAMEKTAWVLETKRGQAIGFVSPAEFRKRHMDEEIVPEKFFR